MPRDRMDFRVTHLEAAVPEGVQFEWHGLEVSTGPLAFELDHSMQSRGVMDYGRSLVSVEYHARLSSPAFEATFCALGVDQSMVSPLRVTLRAEGEILPDHSFNGGLRGQCEIQPLGLLAAGEQIRAEVLPGL